MKIENLYKIYIKYNTIITDSRKVEPNSIFWAIKGDNFDGNNYVLKALANGASYAITSDNSNIGDSKCIIVEDTLVKLQQLAKYHLEQLQIPVLAITGSNGKTTTKELIANVLSQKFNVGYTKGNFNNHLGLPLTILTFSKKTEFAIIEMGANHPNDIKELCEIAIPNYGIITNVGKAHLEGFGSFEGVIKAKRELYKAVEQNNGVIFYNAENKILQEILPKIRNVEYGNSLNSICKAEVINSEIFLNLKLTSLNNEQLEVKTNLFGEYNTENVLAAAAIGKYFEIPDTEIKSALQNYLPENNRSQIFKTEKNTLVLDAYNANPVSMKISIQNFINIDFDNKIAILGDMLELGKYSDQEHSAIINFIIENETKLEKVFFVGANFMKASKEITHKKMFFFSNTEELLNSETLITENSYILLKGSRGIKLEKLINIL